MNGINWLLDSNIVIHLSKKQLSLEDFAQVKDEFQLSIITYMEVLGFRFKDLEEERLTKQICGSLEILFINQSIAEQVIQYRKVRNIKLPNAVLLATARVFNLQLATRNVGDFVGLDPQVMVVNPFDL